MSCVKYNARMRNEENVGITTVDLHHTQFPTNFVPPNLSTFAWRTESTHNCNRSFYFQKLKKIKKEEIFCWKLKQNNQPNFKVYLSSNRLILISPF